MSAKREDRAEMVSLLKAAQWEKCKGELWALSALEGANYPIWNESSQKAERTTWQELADKINTFIDDIENEGLAE